MIRPLSIALLALALVACDRGPGPLTPDPGVDVMAIPSFQLVNQRGETVDENYFRRPGLTVLDFTFTSCPFICPPMNAQMLRMQRELEGLPVRFVSVSVDPERDTPERLSAHAKAIGADTSTWTFLTGDFETVERLGREGLKLAIGGEDARVIELPDGETMTNVPHPSKFVLIRSDGKPIGLYTGTDPEDVDRLIARIRAAFDVRIKREI